MSPYQQGNLGSDTLRADSLPPALLEKRGRLGRGRGGGGSRTYGTRTRSHLARSRMPGRSATTFRLGNRQVAFNAELIALRRGLQLAIEKREEAVYTIFTDSQSAMQRILNDASGPGQSRAIFFKQRADMINQRGGTINVR